MNPMDFVKDWIVPLITANLPTIVMCLAAIAGLAMLLGLLKKLAAATLTALLNAGDAAARMGYGNDSRQNGPLSSRILHSEALARTGRDSRRGLSV
jgi:hypothetical protein